MSASRSPTGQGTLSTVPGGEPPQRHGPRIGGFSLRLTPSGYLLAGLIAFVSWSGLATVTPGESATAYLLGTLGIVVLVIASFFAHELAHAIVARRYGVKVDEIKLGFVAGTGHGDDATTPRAAWRVALAGPLVNVLIAAAAIGVTVIPDGLPQAVFAAVAWANAMIAAWTLLPGAGLDGGRVLRAALWARSGDRNRADIGAGRIAGLLGALGMAAGFAVLFAGSFFGLWVGLFGLALLFGGRAQARQGQTAAALRGMRVEDVLPTGPTSVDSVADWRTVEAFLAERPVGDQATAWPLRDFDGRLSGLLTVSQLDAVRPAARDTARLRQVGVPLPQTVTTTPDEALTDLLPRLGRQATTPQALRAAGHAVVLDAEGSPTAVLTPADFARAVRLGALRQHEDVSEP
jgi:Zn-dependent protease